MTLGKSATWLIGFWLFICGASTVYSQNSPLKVKITVPTTTFRNNEKIYVATAIFNNWTIFQRRKKGLLNAANRHRNNPISLKR